MRTQQLLSYFKARGLGEFCGMRKYIINLSKLYILGKIVSVGRKIAAISCGLQRLQCVYRISNYIKLDISEKELLDGSN